MILSDLSSLSLAVIVPPSPRELAIPLVTAVFVFGCMIGIVVWWMGGPKGLRARKLGAIAASAGVAAFGAAAVLVCITFIYHQVRGGPTYEQEFFVSAIVLICLIGVFAFLVALGGWLSRQAR